MSTSASQQRYAPLYATAIQQQQQQSRAQLPLLRRAATYLISRAGLASASLSQNPHWNDLKWQFAGDSRQLMGAVWASSSTHARPRPVVVMVKPSIQFIRGVDELTVPDVSLTRSKDGLNGVATFIFDQPSVFDSSKELGDITGLYLIDDEGVLQSVDVSAKFLNGKPAKIEAKYLMKTLNEWDRFMRFMERYAAENNLGFVRK